MTKLGYIRVSTNEQNIDRQVEQLVRAGVNDDFLYVDKLSGKNTNRPEFQRMLSEIRRGDELVVSSLDRLGRKYEDVIEVVKLLRDKQVKINILDAQFLNFGTGNSTLDKAMFDMFLSLLSYISQNEREKILERQRQGIKIAKEKGAYQGRQTKYHKNATGADLIIYNKIIDDLSAGVPVAIIAKNTGVSRTLVYKIKRELENATILESPAILIDDPNIKKYKDGWIHELPINKDSRMKIKDTKPFFAPLSPYSLKGKKRGRIKLPLQVHWGPRSNINLENPAERKVAYQAIISEGTPDVQSKLINKDLLVEVWDTLNIPPRARTLWNKTIFERIA